MNEKSLADYGYKKNRGYNDSIMEQERQSKKGQRTVQLRDFNKKGIAFGSTDTDGTLAVPYTIPGETVVAERTRRKEALLKEILTPAACRIDPFCFHFKTCGGCIWQHIDYTHQLQFKRERILRFMQECNLPPCQTAIEIVPSEPYFYRNRMDFTWSYDGRFGLRERGKWYSIVDLVECKLLPEAVMEVALEVNRRVHESALPFRDGKKRRPGLRYLVIRHGVFTGEVMLSFVTDDMDIPHAMWEGMEPVVSVFQLVNNNLENDRSDGEPRHLWGQEFYQEKIGDVLFQVGPRSFFQPNPAVAVQMVDYVKEIVHSLDTRRGLIDLYCGLGLFAVSLADGFERIVGIENNEESIALAQKNARGLPIEFNCKDAEAWTWPERTQFDTLLVDPPRTGLHPAVRKILKDHPYTHLIYVSCNPARGIEDMADLGGVYALHSMRLFDQFPQTQHVEMIALLKRK